MTYKIISANRSRGFSSQSGQSGLIIHLRYAPSFSSISWAFTRLYKALQGFTSLCKPVQALGMGCIWISILPYVSHFCLGVFVVQIDGRNFLSDFLWLVWSIFSRRGSLLVSGPSTVCSMLILFRRGHGCAILALSPCILKGQLRPSMTLIGDQRERISVRLPHWSFSLWCLGSYFSASIHAEPPSSKYGAILEPDRRNRDQCWGWIAASIFCLYLFSSLVRCVYYLSPYSLIYGD